MALRRTRFPLSNWWTPRTLLLRRLAKPRDRAGSLADRVAGDDRVAELLVRNRLTLGVDLVEKRSHVRAHVIPQAETIIHCHQVRPQEAEAHTLVLEAVKDFLWGHCCLVGYPLAPTSSHPQCENMYLRK